MSGTDPIANLQAQIDTLKVQQSAGAATSQALATRITKLEGVIQPPPPAVTESPDLTTVPPAAAIVDAAKAAWTIVGGKVACNGNVIANTSGVILLKYVKHPVNGTAGGVFQQTNGGWWGPMTPTGANVPQVPRDPSVAAPVTPPVTPPVIPPSTTGVPGPAAAVGFNTRTFGPGLVVGSRGTPGANWYPTTNSGSVTQLPNQQMAIRGGSSGFNYEVVTAEPGAGMRGAGNRSFGGGGYFEVLLSMENPGSTGGPTGWPGWWANDMEGQVDTHGPLAQWPGMPPGYGWWFEPDNMEFLNGRNDQYGVQVHNWYGPNNLDFPLPVPQVNIGTANIADPHYYGWLWVPATRTSQGLCAWYFDRVEKSRFQYNYFDRNNPSKGPPNAQNACGGMDTLPDDNGRHFQLILGTGDNNSFTVREVSVWQKDGSKNLFT